MMKMKEKLKRKKWGIKRKISLLLLVMQVVTSIPNHNLMIQVMANPNAGEVAVETEVNGAVVMPEEVAPVDGFAEEELITAVEPFVAADLSGNELFAVSPPMEMEVLAFEPAMISDEVVYDEIIEEDFVISSGTSISNKKVLYKGNLTLNADLSVVNGEVHVAGNLLANKGAVSYTSNAVIRVDGEFRIQSKEESGEYSETSGFMKLTFNSKMIVGGDFYTQSLSQNNMVGKDCILELQADFNHVGDTSLKIEYGGELLFTGKGEQHVSFGKTKRTNGLYGLTVRNELGKLYLDTLIPGVMLNHNVVLAGENVEITNLSTVGHDLTIEGNYFVNENSSANISNHSTLFVQGDLRIQSREEDGTYGETGGYLMLINSSRIVVEGDFYTQSTHQSNHIYPSGTLELRGNFYQIGDTWFNQNTRHDRGKLMFTGEGEQHLSFEGTQKSNLGNMIVNNEQGKLYVDTVIPVFTLMHHTILAGEEVQLKNTGYSYDLKIEGNLLINEKASGPVSSSFSLSQTVFIEGDLRIQSKQEDGTYGETTGYMNITNNRVVVKGDFYTESNSIYNKIGTGGVLELHGNLYHIGDTIFQMDDHSSRLVFAGEGKQHVSAGESGKLELKNIVQNESCTEIALDSPITAMITLGSDVVFGKTSGIGSLFTKGYTVRFLEAVTANGTINMQQGSLICESDLTMIGSGYLYLSEGETIVIEGDFYLKDESRIWMNHDRNLIMIQGSFYNDSTARLVTSWGCLDIKGDYIQTTATQFRTNGVFWVQFSSPDHQTISFPEGADVWFYNLGVDPGLNYTFSKEPIWTNRYPAYDTFNITEDAAAQYFGQAGTNAATGNYSQSFSDLAVQSVIGPLDLTHSYNSLSDEDGILGTGFVFSQNMKMLSGEVMGTEYKTVILPDGAHQTFMGKADGSFVAQDSRGDLIKTGNRYILTTMDQAKFTFDEEGTLLTLEDRIGNKLTYEVNGDGNITSIRDITGTSISMRYEGKRLVEVSNQITGESASFVYVENRLHKSIDTIGNVTSYEYDGDGLLTKIINNDGSVFEEITYISEGSHKGKVNTITNKTGNVDTYVYDTVFRKTTITDSNGRQTIKEYDLSSRVTSSIDELGERSFVNYVITDGRNKYGDIASETDVYGNITSYTRDAKGRVTNVVHPDGSNESTTYDKNGNIVKSVDKNGAATYFIFDVDGKNLLKEVQPLDGVMAYSETADQDLFAITTYTYDMAHGVKGLVATETGPLGDDANYIRNEYNQKGQAVKKTTVINGVPYTTSYTYNEKNLPTREAAPDGVVTEYTYNQRTEVIRKKLISADGTQETVERVVYDNMGQKIKTISPLEYDARKDNMVTDTYSGVGTTLTYDAAGNVLTTTDALGNQVKNTYDRYGNLLTQTFPNGSYSQYSYDKLNRQVTEEFYDHTTSQLKLLKQTSYIQSGRNLQTLVTAYLDENRTMTMSEVTDFAGRVLNMTNAENHTIRKTYTKGGAVATETDVYGKVSTFTYDKRGNLISQSIPFESSSFAKTEYTYDKAGKPLSEIVYNNKVGDSASSTHKTLFEYDAWGNAVKVVQYDGDDAVNYMQSFYDFKGQVIRQYTGLNSPLVMQNPDEITSSDDEGLRVIKYEYNYLGKPVQVTNALGEVETTSYDVGGNILSATDRGDGVYTITYDILGRVRSEEKTAPEKETIYKEFSYDHMGKVISVIENGVEETFQYDGMSQLIAEQSEGITKEYTYDHAGMILVSRIYEDGELLKETRNTYDKMGRPFTISDGTLVKATYSYDKGSRLLTTKYSNGLVESNTYNDAGLPKTIVNKDAAGKVISQYSYTYAVDGNQLSKTDAGGMVTYEYDGLNRLTEEVHTQGGDITTILYEYDENSNMLSKTTRTPHEDSYEHYTYNVLDQLLTQTGTKDQVVYSYDETGNMLTKKTNGKSEVQEYDALNRLISWTDGESTSSYTYHMDNKRGSKTVDGVTTKHIWVGDKIQLDIRDGEVINYVHGLCLIESDYGFYLYNAHGDVVQVVKEGNVISRYDYTAYGQAIGEYAEDENDRNPFRYAGEYKDVETGYIYLRARYYDPDIARFINQDPIRSGANWNIYAGANPVMNRDPSGLFFEKVWAGAKKAGSAVASAATKAGKAVKKFASSNVGKVIIGVAVIAIVAVAVVATGGAAAGLAGAIAVGALKGAIIGAVVGAAVGGAVGAAVHRKTTGSWEGAGQAAKDGASTGFMGGAITGAVGGGAVGGFKYVKEAAAAAAALGGEQAVEAVENTGKVIEKQISVTEQVIRDSMKGAEFESLQTDGVDINKIQEYVDAMLKGEKFPAIDVDLVTKNIVDGNHRYIASKITGIVLDIKAATQSLSKSPIPWSKIPIGQGWRW